MNAVPYILYAAAGLVMSFMGFVFAMTAGEEAATRTGEALLVAYVAAVWYVVRRASLGKGKQAAVVLALPMPIVTVAEVAYLLAAQAISYLAPDSAQFASSCRDVGAVFYRQPVSPVRSIAYVQETKFSPPFTYFRVSGGTRITSLSYSNPPHPAAIEYTEFGPNAIGDPYFRTPRTGDKIGVPALTADALVKYKLSPEEELRKAPTKQGIVHYEVTVIDRRTNETLARLRYVIDAAKNRACGLTGTDTMDERAFVLQAIGLR